MEIKPKDILLTRLRLNIIKNVLDPYGVDCTDEDVMTKLCVLTEHIVYHDNDRESEDYSAYILELIDSCIMSVDSHEIFALWGSTDEFEDCLLSALEDTIDNILLEDKK